MKPAVIVGLSMLFALASVTAVPSAPTAFSATVTGTTVTFTWTPPPGVLVGHRLEAGTAPGLANLASVLIGTAPSFVATDVPSGVYYVRVRAVAVDGDSEPSNEVTVVVSSGQCATPPAAPTNLVGAITGALVAFNWATSGGCAATNYALHVGTGSGLRNVAVVNVGTALSFVASVPPGTVGTFYVRVLSSNAFGTSGPSNEVIVTIGGAPPPPSPGSFGPGQHRVNVDISPGRYYSDPAPGCYFERQSGLGGTFGEIIANEFIGFDAQQWIVDIRSSDVGFETDAACGRWYTTPRHGFQASIPQGMWLVGSQVAPGTYTTFALSGCYWERLRNFDATLSSIIANEFVSGASPQLVTIAASDVGFRADDECGVWSR